MQIMELLEKVGGHCEIRGMAVEILMLKMKKAKQKEECRTPVRCQNSSSCPKSSFCRFVNPLTTHLPVKFADAPGAEAS